MNTQQDKNIEKIEWMGIQKAIESAPEKLDFVLPGLLAGSIGGIIGSGGSGKSMLALELSILLSGGADLLGLKNWGTKWEPKPGKITYLSGEDPEIIIAHRLHNLSAKMDMLERANIIENLSIAPLVGLGLDIMGKEWQHWILQAANGSRLMLLDTLRRFHRMEESDSGQMSHLLGFLEFVARRTGVTILFLHHSNKNAAMNGSAGNAGAARGSSALSDNARWQINLAPMSEQEEKTLLIGGRTREFYVQLVGSKINYHAPLPPLWLHRGKGGVLSPAHLIEQNNKGSNYGKQI